MLSTRTRLNLESLDQRIVPARLDLRTAGSEAVLAGGAIAHRIDGQWNNSPGHGNLSHGTGALQTYLTVDADGAERGYNSNFRPVEFNASSDSLATRALPLANVPVVTVNGQQYREFVLNVDQVNAQGDRQLSVDEVQIFTSTVNNLRNYNNANNTLRAGSLIESPIWSLDALNGSTNDWLQVRAMTNQGNRAGEIALLVPNNLFNASEQFVYLYSRMGATRDANAGAEQWGVRTSPATPPVGGASLSGYVQNVAGNYDPNEVENPGTLLGGIAGVSIQLLNFEGVVIAETTTDADGFFEFEGLNAGSYGLAQVLDEQVHDPELEDYLDFAGSLGAGEIVNNPEGDDMFLGIVLANDSAGTDYIFTEKLGGN